MTKPITPRLEVLREHLPSSVSDAELPVILDALDAIPNRGAPDFLNFYGEPDEAEVMKRLITIACPTPCNREVDAAGKPAGWHKACEERHGPRWRSCNRGVTRSGARRWRPMAHGSMRRRHDRLHWPLAMNASINRRPSD